MTSTQFLWTKYGGLRNAECYVFPVQDKTKSQDLVTCERYRNLLLNWCIGKEGARMRKHAEYVLRSPVIMRRIFLYFNRITTNKAFSVSSVNKGTDQRKSPVWMACLGSSSSRSLRLHGDSRRYKQHQSPGVSIKICSFTARQRLFWHNWLQTQMCGCCCPAEFVNKIRTFC